MDNDKHLDLAYSNSNQDLKQTEVADSTAVAAVSVTERNTQIIHSDAFANCSADNSSTANEKADTKTSQNRELGITDATTKGQAYNRTFLENKLPLDCKPGHVTDSSSPVSAKASNINLIIKRSNDLCDRWHKIGLGKETGTNALNEYLDRTDLIKKSQEKFTTSEMVQVFQTLRPTIKPLPANSEVRRMVRKSDYGEGYVISKSHDGRDEHQQPPSSSPHQHIAEVFEFMSTQPNFQMMKRRKIHHLSGEEVIERLKSYENRVCEVEELEKQVMETYFPN